MKITDLKFGKDKLFSLYVNGEFVCKINDESVYNYHLKIGMEITDDLLDEILDDSKYHAALRDSLKILNYSINTKFGVLQKLKIKGHDNDISKKVIEFLEQNGFINDEVYAENFVSDAVNLKKMGKIRIAFELRKKGISSEIIERTTNDIDESENLNSIVENEIDRMYSIDRKNLDKLRRRLYSKGYNIYDINKAIDGYIGGENFEI